MGVGDGDRERSQYLPEVGEVERVAVLRAGPADDGVEVIEPLKDLKKNEVQCESTTVSDLSVNGETFHISVCTHISRHTLE